MIVKMKKITLLCMKKDVSSTLNTLRDMGALHLSPLTPPNSSNLDKSRNMLKKAKTTESILASYKKKNSDPAESTIEVNKETIIDIVNNLTIKKKELTSKLNNIDKEKLAIEPYSDFDPATVKKLAEQGIQIKLFHVTGKKPIDPPEGTHLLVIKQTSNDRYIAIIGKADFEFDEQEFTIPERSLSQVLADIQATKTELIEIENQLNTLSTKKELMDDVIAEREDNVMLIEAKEGMGASAGLAYILGFCPVDIVDSLRAAATKHGWGIAINEPSNDDHVPTLIKSPAWVKPITGLFSMLDILPGYKEIDIRPVFFLFFGLFFAMLISDAGYGLLFLILALIAKAKMKKAPSGPFILIGVLSICAIVWGVLTGSYFGITDLPAPLSNLKISWLNKEENIIAFAFLIGAIHLSIAHLWRAILTINSTRALAQAGWICLTWTMFLLSRSLILGAELPFFFNWLLITGLLLVAIFMTPFKLLKTEWADHVMLPFDVVGNFADLVSYVRLFAVGSASLAVAEAFNELAIGNGIDGIGAGIAAIIILFLGHSLNIILGLMSILVHGVRLNTLEFSGHIGLEWSGFKYKPFAGFKSGDIK